MRCAFSKGMGGGGDQCGTYSNRTIPQVTARKRHTLPNTLDDGCWPVERLCRHHAIAARTTKIGSRMTAVYFVSRAPAKASPARNAGRGRGVSRKRENIQTAHGSIKAMPGSVMIKCP